MTIAERGVTASQPAVIATRPARQPLSAIEKSMRLSSAMPETIAARMPAAAASVVFTSTRETTCGSALRAEAPLKPNQPNQSRNTPIVASGMLWPMIAMGFPLTYFPMRGPSSRMPESAAQPPTLCTKVEPAKSWKLNRSSSQPPPHPQEPRIGYTIATYTAVKTM